MVARRTETDATEDANIAAAEYGNQLEEPLRRTRV